MMGLTYVTRNFARDQHAWVWSDFLDAVKSNWKQGMLMGLIKGLLMMLAYVVVSLYFQLYQVEGGLQYYALGWLMVGISALGLMADIYIWPMIISYDLKLRHIIRNSIVLAVARLPWSVLFLILVLVPLALIVFIHPLFALYYLLIGFAVPFVYEGCLRFEEKCPRFFKYPWIDRANKLAELICGFIFGFGIVVL